MRGKREARGRQFSNYNGRWNSNRRNKRRDPGVEEVLRVCLYISILVLVIMIGLALWLKLQHIVVG